MRAIAYFKYIVDNRIFSLLFVVLIAAYLSIILQTEWQFSISLKDVWNEIFNHVVGIATVIVAVAVWFAELTEEWREQLPKRLTVNFVYLNNKELKTVMRCEKAHLSDIADVRALGQQIGSQLVNLGVGKQRDDPNKESMIKKLFTKKPPQKAPAQLSFCAPYITQDKGDIEYCPEIGFFRHFTVEFTLTKLPNGLDETKCKLWVAPFGEENISY